MDLADEIAYAAHDLEDGFRMKTFTTDELLHDFCKLVTDKDCRDELEKIFTESKERAGFKSDRIESVEFSKLYHKEIASRIIYTLIHDIGIVKLSEEDRKKKGIDTKEEIGFAKYKDLASGLKKTTFRCITNNDGVYTYENKGREMMTWLYGFYMDHSEYLPPDLSYER